MAVGDASLWLFATKHTASGAPWGAIIPVVLALLGIALVLAPLPRRASWWAGIACWIAAGEVLLTNVLHGAARIVSCIAFAAVVILIALLIARRARTSAPPASQRKYGLVSRPGSYSDVSQATFHNTLDTAIDAGGDVDASRAKFGVTPASSQQNASERTPIWERLRKWLRR